MISAWLVCLGLEPRVAGWKEQCNPLSYVGTPSQVIFLELSKALLSPLGHKRRRCERETLL